MFGNIFGSLLSPQGVESSLEVYSKSVTLAATRPLVSRIKTAPALNSITTTREEHNWWCENGGGYVAGGNESEKDKGVAVASELAALASYMAGYLKGAGATCAPSGSPQYHTHHGHHPAMSVGTHHHAHSHSHPGGPHPSLSSPFALATHGHPHGHPLDHGLGGFPQ
ncbi:hypothetical protein PV326_002610, partial [Microctonus aethiopoides]